MTKPLTPMPFADAWTLAAAQAYFAVDAARPEDTDKTNSKAHRDAFEDWRTNSYGPVWDKLEKALVQHLLFLADNDRLGRIENTEGTSVSWVKQWNRMVDKNLREDDFLYMGDMRLGRMAYMDLAVEHSKTGDVIAARDRLIKVLDAGDIQWFQLEVPECLATGQRFATEIHNWQPTLGTLERRKGGSRIIPLKPGQFSDPGVECVTINAPSGELLINDWFRIDAFTKICQDVLKDNKCFSVNSDAGVIAQTSIYANKLGFASVFVGNSCPSVFARDGNLAIGLGRDNGEDPVITPNGKELGSVCTDLWWTTIIDRQVLTDLVATTMPRAQAIQEVDDIIKEYSHTMMIAHVEPGTHHLYFSGSPSTFQKTFASEELALDDFDEPMFVLSATPLTLKDPAPAQKRRPAF
jgi:hypothetical protein